MASKRKITKTAVSFLCMMMICTSSLNVLASDAVTKTYTFDTTDKKETHPEKFDQKLSKDGKTYSLANVKYTVKDKVPIETEKETEKVVESDFIASGTDYVPEQTITENGVTFKYSSKEATENGYSNIEKQVTGYTDYDYQVTSADVPQTKDITVADATGQEQTVTCNLTDVQQLSGTWTDTYIDITFISYDSEIFEWNGIEVAKNDVNPLAGYDSQLLASVGANTTDYRITNVSWNGGTYLSDGTVCRDARAAVQRYVRYYRANYAGTTFEPGTKYKVIYKGTEQVKSDTEFNYSIDAIATYTIEKTPTIYYVLAGVGLIAVFGGIIGILLILSKKRKKEEA